MKRSNPERGVAIVLVLIALLVATLIGAGFLLKSNTLVQATRFQESKKISFNRSETGLGYGESGIEDYINKGMKSTFHTLDSNGVIIPEASGGEYNKAVQIFTGGVNGDSYGLDDGDEIDLLYLFNSYNHSDPITGDNLGAYLWQKVSASQRKDEYIYFSYKTTAHPTAERFSSTAVIAPGPLITQSNTGVITAHYRYAVASIGSGKSNEYPNAPSNSAVYALLDSPSTAASSTLNLSSFQSSSYDSLLSCFNPASMKRMFSQENEYLVSRGTFEVKIFPPNRIVSNFLPQYPPVGSPYTYGEFPESAIYDSSRNRIMMTRMNGMEIIDATTGQNASVSIPEGGNFQEGLVFCGPNNTKVCMPISYSTCGSTCTHKGDLVVVNVDPTSAQYKTYQIVASPSAAKGDRYLAWKNNYVAYTGTGGHVALYNQSTSTMQDLNVSTGTCSAVAVSPVASDSKFYVGCGNKVYVINPQTGSTVKTITFPFTNNRSAVVGSDLKMYITDYNHQYISTIDLTAGTLLSTIPSPWDFGRELENGLSTDGKTLRVIGRVDNGPGTADDKYYLYTYDVSGAIPSLVDQLGGVAQENRAGFLASDGTYIVANRMTPHGRLTRFFPGSTQMGRLCESTLAGN